MSEFLELAMVLSFGAAWPTSIAKSLRARTAKGKSVVFLFILMFGYACGIASKFIGNKVNYVVYFYMLNFCMVTVDMLLYFRNQRLDRQRAQEAPDTTAA